MAKYELEKVFEPIDIGPVHLKNRFIRMGAQASLPRDDEGPDDPISPRWISYYKRLAEGGFALISIAGGILKFDDAAEHGCSPMLDTFKPEGLKMLADTIHAGGAKAFFQLLFGYPTPRLYAPGGLSLASSDLPVEEMDKIMPFYNPTTGMTKEQIYELEDTFARYAKMLQGLGFDGVELNAGHNHGLNSFLSPAWNKRTDEYGGCIENRTRLMCEINRKIKETCGEGFAVINNFSGCEFNLDGGTSVADACAYAEYLEKSGADAIHVRYEVYLDAIDELNIVRTAHETPDIDLYPNYTEKDLLEYGIDNRFGNGIAAWSGSAAEVKKHVSIPVSVSGRMDAFVGEQLIREGKLDLVNIARRAIADHDYVKKIIDGDYDDIRPCVGCYTCYETSERHVEQWCMANPCAMTSEEYSTVFPAEKKKRVLVIGSGAAGLESARVLALRGHEVILCEKEPNIGGSLPLAAMIKEFHEDFYGLSQWQQRQVKKLGVDIRTKTTVDKAYVEQLKPDAIIVAVGAAECVPDLPGIDNKIVMTGEQLHKSLRLATKFFSVESLGKLSKLYLPLGKKVVLMGGAIHGVQTAYFLMRRGREVVICEESDEYGAGMLDCGPKPNMLRWLYWHNCEMHKNVKFKEITDKGLVIIENGEEKLIEADNVVTTLPMLNNMSLYDEIKDLAPEVYAIGDCNPFICEEPYPALKLEPVKSKMIWPRFTVTAIREAYRICREI